jgi:hypothetical protein
MFFFYPVWGGDEYKNRVDVKIRLKMLFAVFENHPKIIVTKLTSKELQKILMQKTDCLINETSFGKTKIPGLEYRGIIDSDTALDSLNELNKISIFMSGIQGAEKYKYYTFGGIIAIPVNSFIVGLRLGGSIESLNGKVGDRPIIKIIQTAYGDTSSRKARKAVKEGKAIDVFLNQNVQNIVEKYKLYRE